MRFPLVSPATLAELARTTVGQVVETAAAAATIPFRVLSALGQAELLVSRITVIADQAEALIRRVSVIVGDVEGTVADARTLVGQAGEVADGAAGVVSRAADVSQSADGVVTRASVISTDASAVVRQAGSAAAEATELLQAYAATLRKGAPLAARFVDELSADEVTAAIRMVDQLPRLQHHLINDVMPLLAKLDQVGPDLHRLLTVTEDLHLAILGLPGLKMLRRRGEERAEHGES
ncbi:hypothetical protein GCM10010172_42890 [Paractinoplanes ferrugineus]|uniref:Ribulose 1,5-bisphosphate carboxylase large subunit n=1 Tax=Paractinoplanes ferrugineus TaxID=113564 RepID=A0A919J4Z0_9ACTN|nr:hypothetical protein [Actinoplanes ferrugineus]GIE13447.1 hypothetical protein Afe05nite_52870 [Actinoplanes ferrugineus]